MERAEAQDDQSVGILRYLDVGGSDMSTSNASGYLSGIVMLHLP